MFTPSILFVDDDPIHLKTIRHIFKNQAWILDVATSGTEAFEKLSSNEYHIVITDLHMPDISGLEVLKKATEYFPQTLCMVLSSDQEKDSVLKAINEGHIWQYIPKPWRAEEFLFLVKNAVELASSRAREKQLIYELELKNRSLNNANKILDMRNQELALLNKNLEDLICDRTTELQSHSEALRLLAEKDDSHTALDLLLNFLRQELGTSNIHLAAEHINRPDLSYPIHYAHETIGYLNIRDLNRMIDNHLLGVIERSLPLIELCASHRHIKNESPKLIHKLDEFLEHL